MSKSYRDLKVWQKAMDLSELVHEATRAMPKEERYGLTSQMRRASVSIPSNIAEGHGRNMNKSFVQFLRISQGSLKELDTQLILSSRLGYIKPTTSEEILGHCEELGRMIHGLVLSVQRKSS